MEERFEAFTVLLSKLNRCIKRMKAEQMAQFQLKGPHVSCLYYLSEAGALTAAQLCERCEEDKAAISRSLEYLEQNGYILYETEKKRRYNSPIHLTEKGKQVCCAMREKIDRIVALASDGISEKARETMYETLTQISENLVQALHAEQTERNTL